MYENYITTKSTIKVFDEFLKSDEQYFCIKDNFAFYYNDIYFAINFIISSKTDNQNILKSNITITDFKKIYTIPHYKDLEQITDCLNHNKEDFKLTNIPKISLPVFDFICTFKDFFVINLFYTKKNTILKFPIPISINVQSSIDITYGYYSDGSHNFYGDTSQFLIVGYIIK